ACCFVVEQFCETEVEHFNLTARRNHHVAGFDVAMNDASSVCSAERIRSLQRDRQSTLERQRTTIHELPHVLAFDVLHGNEVNAVDLVEIEDGADVWMVERRGQTRFAFETLEICFACGQLGGQNFDDERAAELGIDRFIDGSLSALTELLENLVVP